MSANSNSQHVSNEMKLAAYKKVGQSVTIQKMDSELGVGEVSVEDWHTCTLQIFVICIVQVLW
jgi:hypothetical protein